MRFTFKGSNGSNLLPLLSCGIPVILTISVTIIMFSPRLELFICLVLGVAIQAAPAA